MSIIDIIEEAASLCDNLECDGTTRVLTYVLTKHNIPHKVMVGSLNMKVGDEGIPLHYWIELPSGHIIDYKAQMWLDENAPNGIFRAKDYPEYIYDGKEIQLEVSDTIFKILTM